MKFEATNNFIYVIRDEAEKEIGGLLIPGKGQERQAMGTVHSVGFLTRDPKIKKGTGKKVRYFKGTGFPQEIDGIEYLVLTDDQITGIEK